DQAVALLIHLGGVFLDRLRFIVEAAVRERHVSVSRPVRLVVILDSLRSAILSSIDELRARIAVAKNDHTVGLTGQLLSECGALHSAGVTRYEAVFADNAELELGR